MPRYDEMDEIVRGVRERLGQAGPAGAPTEQSLPTQRSKRDVYAEAVELTMLSLRHAQQLHDHLTPRVIHRLTNDEHEDLVNLLGRTIQELQACQTGLQGVISE